MVKLECWLPKKEMFGVFSLDSITFKDYMLKAVVTNEVYKLTISFSGHTKACQVTETARKADWLAALRADHEVLMRGNTFFRLQDPPSEPRYLIAAPNYIAEFFTDAPPSVQLAKSDQGR